MRSIDEKFIALAEKLAHSSMCKYKHGCLITKRKEILSLGINRAIGFDTVLTRYGFLYTLHAEMDAIRKLNSIPDNVTLYIARRLGRLSKPCDICMRIIRNTGKIKRIVFSDAGGIKEMII